MGPQTDIVATLRSLVPVSLPDDAWIVGGAVRDALLGREPLDIDVTTRNADALAAHVAQQLGTRAIPIGSDPVTWRVPAGRRTLDFAPLQGKDIDADLLRRDFTINAIAVPTSGELRFVDPSGGVRDADDRLLRMIRPSNFDDDPLRLLRAARFATTLGVRIEPETVDAIIVRAPAVRGSAPERIRYELERMLTHDSVTAVRLLRDLSLALHVLDVDIDERTLTRLERASPNDVATTLAILHAGQDPDGVFTALRSAKWSSAVASRAVELLRASLLRWDHPDEHVLRVYEMGSGAMRQLRSILAADGRDEEIAALTTWIAARDDAWWTSRPILRGEEVASITGRSGRALGDAMRALFAAHLRGVLGTRDAEEAFARDLNRADGA